MELINNNKKIAIFLKIGLVLAIFAVLYQKGALSISQSFSAFRNIQYISIVFLFLGIASTFSILRWQIILKSKNVELPFIKAFQIKFIGNFFNLILPGAVSGDILKTFYLSKYSKSSKTKSLSSIFLDRIIGVLGLVVVSGLGFLLFKSNFKSNIIINSIAISLVITFIILSCFFIYLLFISQRFTFLDRLLEKITLKFPILNPLFNIYKHFKEFSTNKGNFVSSLALSILIHFLNAISFMYIAKAFDIHLNSLLPFLSLVPLGLLVTTIPISPAGLGTGHAAYLYLFRLVQVERGADFYTIFISYFILTGMFLGGASYLLLKPDKNEILKAEEEL